MLEYYMDYKKIFFLFCDDLDVDNVLHAIRNANQTDAAPPVIFFAPETDIMDAPFQIIGGAYYEIGDKHFTNRSDLDEFELIFTCSGHGIVKIDEEEYHCTPNTLLLIDCNKLHFYRVANQSRWAYKHLHFKVGDHERLMAEKALGFLSYAPKDTEQHFDDVFDEVRNMNLNSSFVISNHISNLLTQMIIEHSKFGMIGPHFNLIQNAAKYMREHYMDKININELAINGFISVFYFTRLFKDYYGTSPYDYLVKYRINQAKTMLTKWDSIQDIAYTCGFGNASNFSRVFKAHMGMSPNQYRNHCYQSNTKIENMINKKI